MTGIRWNVLAIVVVAGSVSYMLRFNVSMIGEEIARDLGMSVQQLGIVFAAFAAGYALFQFPGGVIGDRLGPRRTISSIAIIWTLLTVITAVIPGSASWSVGALVAALFVTRLMVGLSNGPFFPVSYGGTIEAWFPFSQWGLASGVQIGGYTLGAAATGPLMVWLTALYGWRGALLLTAPTGFLIAAVYYWYITDDPADHAQMTESELDVIRSDRPPGEESVQEGAWKLALGNRNILLLTIAYFCMNYIFYLFFNWFPYYLVSVKGFAAAEAAVFVSTQWISGAVGGVAGGYLCDVLVKRYGIRHGPRLVAVIGLLLCGTFLYVGAMTDVPGVAVALLCVSFGLTQVTDTPFWVATMALGGNRSQAATGVLNTGGNLPGVVGGLMVPFISAAFGWTAALASGALFAIVGAFLWLFVRTDEPMGEAHLADA